MPILQRSSRARKSVDALRIVQFARERQAVRSVTNSFILLLPSLSVTAVGWLAPIDVLERLPWIGAIASRLGIDAVIKRLAEVSAFPQVTFATYFMVAVLLVPLSLWAASRMFMWRGVPPTDGVELKISRSLWQCCVGLALLVTMVFGVFWIPGDPSTCRGCTTDSRFGLGVVLGLITYSIPFLTGVISWRFFAAIEQLRLARRQVSVGSRR